MNEDDPPPVLSGEGRHVLVVEDDGELRPLLLALLRRSGFRASGARNGVEMREVLAGAARVDLVLLDVMLPGRSGFELCRDIRAQGDLPVILLTALGEASDRVVGLELGADDYMVKPPDPRELVARIRAVLRRRDGGGAVGTGGARDRAVFGGWTLDTRRRELTAPGGGRVELTSGEYDLLLAFVERPQRVLSRDQLLDLARGRAFGGLGRSVDAQVSRLRGKLGGRHDEAVGVIKTLRGAGYMLACDVEWS
ncbi:response regulator transcription factor [Siccirubricoccus sp. KC 17139]|uniref:Response regulator transcription factor n=1 Tax=Siccirubricoccus soli TaxID=2899147 RepID=A0ABT1D4H7_9PROT|nr:response regulator transcription factor [Siccirubricoccus soli]MCO6416114.1 response regulator transcription factor [Siccirubricoccus soli]MCP2682248.1 response regulator transcription factor [Siccirubricoccus soli]